MQKAIGLSEPQAAIVDGPHAVGLQSGYTERVEASCHYKLVDGTSGQGFVSVRSRACAASM